MQHKKSEPAAHARPGLFRQFAVAVGVLSMVAAGSVAIVTGMASATQPVDHQVTICHANDSNTNPYVEETVDIGSTGYLKGGHNGHTGPIWDPTLKDQHIQWGDIIPPYVYTLDDGSTFSYAGLNWSTAGQTIYRAGCATTPTSVVPGTPTAAPQTCNPDAPDAPISGSISVPSTTGVVYMIGKSTVSGTVQLAPGDYTVTAVAADGYALTGTTSWDLTVAEAGDCSGQETVVPTAPTFNASQCDGLDQPAGSYEIPSSPGVEYLVGGVGQDAGSYPLAPGQSVIVVATVLPGYALALNATTQWSFTNPVQSCITMVDLVAPTLAASECDGGRQPNGSFTIPTVVGVTWTVNGKTTAPDTYPIAPGVSVTVAAHLIEGYQFGEDTTTEWTFTNRALNCAPPSTPPPPVSVGPANPAAAIAATCARATVRLSNLTAHVGDAATTMQVTVNGVPWGSSVTLAAGATQVLTYARPATVISPIDVAVVDEGTKIASQRMTVCTVVQGVTIPGTKPPAAAPAADPAAVPAALPHTGADGLGLAVLGGGLVLLGGLLVAFSLGRREEHIPF